ncbi:putative molybdenum cofactor sulfurase [Hyaloscypha bicolor E]|uniref:Putative molybdenum cofactor sulfurase n=1 Tax=Hyaloscypha bicolor E TaxID=1095630 RepID=A0A2J6SMG7_9HELO|nr:putative molybdenum cofactor sulfurase [Hyaloscypha bicolor E]PMD51962.1 putative molybdenum cofactor sulfurase [Hyaloscypha bicolor E]
MSGPPQSPLSARRQSRDDNSSYTLVSNSTHISCLARPMAYNESVDDFRDVEYPMMKGKTYLDHAGSTIYAKSLIEEFSRKMISNLYGNPHSTSDPSQLSGHMVDSIREKTLAFFKADPEHFDIVFTANATAAIKLVGECFRDLASESPMSSTFWYGYHKDAHTSVVGIREMTKGNHHCFTSDDEVERWLNSFQNPAIAPSSSTIPGLFCYPGQSNMTGRRLPLSWTRKLRQSNVPSHQNTYSLLDAAALATATQLDFSNPDAAPDFTAVSFYKIFGFPDLGALIVRKESGHILGWRKYFGGGTISSLTVFHEASVQRKDATLHDALEDGTLPFHNIIALGCAIDVHIKLYGSMKTISQHTSFLSRRLYLGMINLHHFNGTPLCVIYNDIPDICEYGDPVTQGGTVAFNLMKADGGCVGHSQVEKVANEKGIFLRSGGLCNAGGIASYLHVEPWQFKRAWSAGHRCGEEGIDLVNGKPTGVVRASLGAMSTIADVDTFLDFLADVSLSTMSGA